MTAPITNSSGLENLIPDQTSRSGLITSTASDQLLAAMANPSLAYQPPATSTTATGTPTASQPKGVQNPYGVGISAFEPNTTPYIQQAADSSQLIKSIAAPATSGDASSGMTDATLTPETQNQQAQDAVKAASSMGYASGGIVDATGRVKGLIQAALQLAANHVPYVWGGTSASGVDCSGLIDYAAKAAGITGFKRYVAADFGKMPQVDAANARPGDIVYWSPGQDGVGSTGHVGIFLGNGMMVAAPQSGENVTVERVFGTPTYHRVFTDNQFGTVATPTGASSYNYGGLAWNPMSTPQAAIAQINHPSMMNDSQWSNYLSNRPTPGARQDSVVSGMQSGQYDPGASYDGQPITSGSKLSGGVPYAAQFQAASVRYGVPAALLAAVARQESGFNPSARSGAGAVGLMQFMPGTASGLGVNPLDPTSSINGAAKYLQGLYRQFGSWSLALAAYNAGPGNVSRYGGIPPFAETQNYVRNVTALAAQYGG